MKREKPEYIFILPLVLGLLSFCFSCGVDDFIEPDYLLAPQDLRAFPHDGYIELEFISENAEQRFDGFNVYVSRYSPIGALPPLDDSGTLPTVPSTSFQVAQSPLQKVMISFESNNIPLENGVTYYIGVTAHNYQGLESDFCNEVNTTPRPESVTPVFLNAGSGYSLKNNSFLVPYDFELVLQSNLLYLSSVDHAMKDEGYYFSAQEYNKVDPAGFLIAPAFVRAVPGHVYLIRSAETNYGKVYITETGPDWIRFHWAYQSVPQSENI